MTENCQVHHNKEMAVTFIQKGAAIFQRRNASASDLYNYIYAQMRFVLYKFSQIHPLCFKYVNMYINIV